MVVLTSYLVLLDLHGVVMVPVVWHFISWFDKFQSKQVNPHVYGVVTKFPKLRPGAATVELAEYGKSMCL